MDLVTTLSDWLTTQLQQRGWSMRELGRRSNISHAQISDVINGKSRAGADFCVAIAQGLGEPVDAVLRRAGLLPPLPPAVEEERELLFLLRRLPGSAREMIVMQIRALAEHEGVEVAPSDETYEWAQNDELEQELLDEFRQLPEEWQLEAIREVERLHRFRRLPAVRIIGEEEPPNAEGAEKVDPAGS